MMTGKEILKTIALISMSIAVGVIVVKGLRHDEEIGRRFYVELIETHVSCINGKPVIREVIPVDVIYDSGKVKTIKIERFVNHGGICK